MKKCCLTVRFHQGYKSLISRPPKFLLAAMLAATAIFAPATQAELLSEDLSFSEPTQSDLSQTKPGEPFQSEPSETPSLDDQIRLIDTEIIILKAELAEKNEHWMQLEQYLEQIASIDDAIFSEDMKARIQRLNAALQAYQSDSTGAKTEAETPLASSFQPDFEKVVILLPLSGAYEPIGREILAGLQQALGSNEPVVIDSEIYDSMLELWELVRLYNPSLIIGPLDKTKARDFSQLGVEVPNLLLNEVPSLRPSQAVFSLSRSLQAIPLAHHVAMSSEGSVLILTDDSSSAKKLVTHFRQAWSDRKREVGAMVENGSLAAMNEVGEGASDYSQHSLQERDTVNSSLSDETESQESLLDQASLVVLNTEPALDQALAKGLNIEASEARKNWLKRQLNHPLYFEPRARHDISTVVSFLPYDQAMQVSPLLNFYHRGQARHLWLPSQLPRTRSFEQSIPFWQRTHALLPSYYADPFTRTPHEADTPSDENSESIGKNDKTGIFYAFGQVAAKVVNRLAGANTETFATPLGNVRFWKQHHAYLVPGEYRLGEGRIERQDVSIESP